MLNIVKIINIVVLKMAIINKVPSLFYSYNLKKTSRFGAVTSYDPHLLMFPQELAKLIYNKKGINCYSPLTMTNWLEKFYKNATRSIVKTKKF